MPRKPKSKVSLELEQPRAEGPWPLSGPGLKSSPAKHSFSKLAFRQVRGALASSGLQDAEV